MRFRFLMIAALLFLKASPALVLTKISYTGTPDLSNLTFIAPERVEKGF